MTKRRAMVSWYGGQLIYTGLQALQQKLLKQSDLRISRGAPTPPTKTTETRELWVDYVADVADGYETTYTVARALERPLGGTKSGELLIMGGDEIYPSPKLDAYEARLIRPYEDAFQERSKESRPKLYALPGNHDWYDGLYLFTQLFCAKEEVAGMKTEQTHSYFALSLRSGWWLLALDAGLNEDIDSLQLGYFKSVIDTMEPSDRLILCTAQPYWTFEILYNQEPKTNLKKLLGYIQDKGLKVPLRLTGDLHHYQRHHKKLGGEIKELALTAGGGGAFLHPTHSEPCWGVTEKEGQFALEESASFPSKEESREEGRLWKMFAALSRNWGLFIVMGIFYALWALPMPHIDDTTLVRSLWLSLYQLGEAPSALLWIIGLFLAGVFFTDSHCKWFRGVASALHMLTHLGASFLANWLACQLFDEHVSGWVALLLFVTNAGIGGVIGALVMMLYLYISMAYFGRHGNETFSWLQIKDYKNFLRLHLSGDALTVYVITLRTPASTPSIHETLLYRNGAWTKQ